MKDVRLGIIANTSKKAVEDVLPPFFRWLGDEGVSFTVASDLAKIIDIQTLKSKPPEMIAEDSDFVLSFGGDGTFLQTARLVHPHSIPIIGINLGAFGYLAEVSVEQLNQRIMDLLEGKYFIQERFTLEAVAGGKQNEPPVYGLNDIVVDKGDFPRTIRLETRIDDEYLNTFTADGLIVSTPTGSTGYSLSVGGPIVEPEVDAMIISPINPHMLANRPLVVGGDRTVSISTFTEAGSYQVTADGQIVMKLDSGEKVTIKRSSRVTRIVHFKDRTFYSLLRNKLHWRDQTNRRLG